MKIFCLKCVKMLIEHFSTFSTLPSTAQWASSLILSCNHATFWKRVTGPPGKIFVLAFLIYDFTVTDHISHFYIKCLMYKKNRNHNQLLQRSAKRCGCLLSYSQAEPGRELTQPSPRLLAEPCRWGIACMEVKSSIPPCMINFCPGPMLLIHAGACVLAPS